MERLVRQRQLDRAPLRGRPVEPPGCPIPHRERLIRGCEDFQRTLSRRSRQRLLMHGYKVFGAPIARHPRKAKGGEQPRQATEHAGV